MIQTRFRYATLALALLLGSVSLWGQVNRNRPTTRPETVGASILPNGGLEDPAPSTLPPMPSRPSGEPYLSHEEVKRLIASLRAGEGLWDSSLRERLDQVARSISSTFALSLPAKG